MGWYFDFKPYVPVAQRRANAQREVQKRKKQGQAISPVVIEGNKIAKTFWGKAWCENLEAYSDYSNRLPRGRTYVRNGSVVDLQISPTKITALVSGSELYEVRITITALRDDHWKQVKSQCAGEIGTLVELIQGKLSKNVMDVVTQRNGGLFPKPSEIKLSCSCPDSAGMCKHIAATMYGVGARLDKQPELLFHLRKVDHLELLLSAGMPTGVGTAAKQGTKTLASSDLADMFGIELTDPGATTESDTPAAASPSSKPSRKPRKTAAAGSPASPGRAVALEKIRGTIKSSVTKPKLAAPASSSPAKTKRGKISTSASATATPPDVASHKETIIAPAAIATKPVKSTQPRKAAKPAAKKVPERTVPIAAAARRSNKPKKAPK